MDVTVDLLTTEKNTRYKSVQLLSYLSTGVLGISFLLFFIANSSQKDTIGGLIFYELMSILPVLLLSNLYLALSKGGVQNIGQLKFSDKGLTIETQQKSRFIELKNLRGMKISLNEYKGEPTISIHTIRLPKQGIENFLWTDKSNKNDKLRFQLLSSEHHHRLNNRIISWQDKYPMIEK